MITNDGRFGALQCDQDRKAEHVEATEFTYGSKGRSAYGERVLKIEPCWDMVAAGAQARLEDGILRV
eukprot:9273587-Pyramimonas_sp.AAC.1